MLNLSDIAGLGIKGFLAQDEGQRLYELAKVASPLGPCLEIGSYCGKSSVYIGLGCKESGQILFSIDHHRGSEEQQPGQEYYDPELLDPLTGKVDTLRLFRATLAKAELEDTVVPIVSTSAVTSRSWATPLGLVFIDGSHAYEAVLIDYSAWAMHIAPGGFLAIHDIFPDPKDGGQAPYLIYQKAAGSGLFTELPRINTLGILKRLRPADAG